MGDLAMGDLSMGDLAMGDLAMGDLATGDLAMGDLATGDLATGDLATGDLLMVPRMAQLNVQMIDSRAYRLEPQGLELKSQSCSASSCVCELLMEFPAFSTTVIRFR